MIPRQSRQIPFCEEFTQTVEKVPGELVILINSIFVTITLILFMIYDKDAENILRSNRNVNMTMSYGKYGRSKIGALFSIPLAYPYLKNQITGPDYRIIQCGQIDSLGSWQDQWCAYHQRRIILSWLLIFVRFSAFFIYLSIALLVVLCNRSYRISKLWIIYQFQYRKGLFLEWLKKQEKKANQHTDPETTKNVKSDIVNNEINKVEVVTIR
ncbi:hypothetical protein F8M41_019418 [Gigaspora margarita]|uniref:Uncharacterized protein n=1 Tax=Gigaspora margarita TaxID=4874 RepID=A0A8H4EU26_GIGMA|nr:hypothetical protein F8M41_019418 [Gigaspora margarita]